MMDTKSSEGDAPPSVDRCLNGQRSPLVRLNQKELPPYVSETNRSPEPSYGLDVSMLEWALKFMKNYERKRSGKLV